MKKNLLSCLVAASLVFGVGLGYVQTATVSAEDAQPGDGDGQPAAESEAKKALKAEVAKKDEMLKKFAEKKAGMSEKNQQGFQGQLVGAYEHAVKEGEDLLAKSAESVVEDSEYTAATTKIMEAAKAAEDYTEPVVPDPAQPDPVQPKPEEETEEQKTLKERETAKADADAAIKTVKEALCDLDGMAKMPKEKRWYIEGQVENFEAVLAKFDVKKLDDKDGLKALKDATEKVNTVIKAMGADAITGESTTGPKSDDFKMNELLYELKNKEMELNELIVAINDKDRKSDEFNKFFDCYEKKELDAGEHLKGIDEAYIKDVLADVMKEATCDTHKSAEEIVALINKANKTLKDATKCDLKIKGTTTNTTKPGKSGQSGQSGKPALPATGEVATALPLVLFASASVLTALRKKH